ncbi:MAG: hypothetical protein L0332_34530 [Chloroflexi bacterium]|nr:hypothetical protein [Chloroflexota bacterium]
MFSLFRPVAESLIQAPAQPLSLQLYTIIFSPADPPLLPISIIPNKMDDAVTDGTTQQSRRHYQRKGYRRVLD